MKKLISFILPIYNEEETLPRLWEELNRIKNILQAEYLTEFIFINDGSQDASANILQELYQQNPQDIRIVNFTTNYGHQIAITAGQERCRGDAVIIMDSDLQDPPLVCIDLVKKWQEGYEIVYAQRSVYRAHFLKRACSYFFYRILRQIASVDIPIDTGDFRLISRRVNQEMLKYKEKSRFLRGISCLTGFKSAVVSFVRSERFAGKPSYTFIKSLKLALDGITGFSLFPIRFISFIGLLLSISSFIFGIIYICYAIITHSNILGWASIMAVIIFLGGMQILLLGILGEYLGRVYYQVLDRPLYTVKDEFGF